MMQFVETTVYLTVTVLLILLFKKLLQRRLSAKQQILIWLLLLVRLFVPVLPQSSFSVFNAVKVEKITFSQNVQTTQVQPEALIQAQSNAQQPTDAVVHTAKPQWSASEIFGKIWLIGAVGLLLFFVISYHIFVFRTAKMPKVMDRATMRCLSECKRRLRIRRRISVVCGGETPLLTGMFRPAIVLPSGYSETEQKDIFLHELCHLKNGDIALLWLAMVILCFNWFNPVIWYAFFVFRRDVELFCDQRVLRYSENKKEYASLLLKTALRRNSFVFGTTALQNGEKEVSRRIRHIALFKKPKLIWTFVALLLAAALCTACLTNPSVDYSMSQADFAEYTGRYIGSIMADLDYLSEEKVVFHYLNGFFVYDLKQEKLTQAIDLSKLNCAPHQQGSFGLEVSVDEEGKTALLTNYGPAEEIAEFDNYTIDLGSGSVKKTNRSKEKFSSFGGFSDTFSTLPNARGWFSNTCVQLGGDMFYLTDEQAEISGLKLIRVSADGAEEQIYLLGDGDGDITEFTPGDIENLTLAELEWSGEAFPNMKERTYYSTSDEEKLARLAQMLKNASPIKGATKCPFHSFLYLTRKDGTKGVITLAADSCAIYRSGKQYYDYSDGDNSELLALFGVNTEKTAGNPTLYERTEQYLKDEFTRVYSPLYDIQKLEISNWQENGNEATFFYKMTYLYYNRDPDQVEYVQKAKNNDKERYHVLYQDYLALKEGNYEFKVEIGGDENNPLSSVGKLTLYHNAAPKGVEWQPVKIDDFVN